MAPVIIDDLNTLRGENAPKDILESTLRYELAASGFNWDDLLGWSKKVCMCAKKIVC